MARQNDIERLQDKMERGLISASQANVELVKIDRVKLVTTRLPIDVRRALNEAVKNGELGHIKKEGRKPEAYFHPSFEYLVAGERNSHERMVISAVARVAGVKI